MEAQTDQETTAEREIVVSRIIEAPRSLVFRTCSEAEHLSQWWGPSGFTLTTHDFDFRPGGVWNFTMHGPDGTDYPNYIEWTEITPPERILFRHGNAPGDPDAFEGSLLLIQRDTGTEVTLRSVFKTKELKDRVVVEYGAIEGAHQTLDRLAAYVVEFR